MSKLGHSLVMLLWMPTIVLATATLIHSMTIIGLTWIVLIGVISSVINLAIFIHSFEDAIYCDQNRDQYVRREWDRFIDQKTTTTNDRQKIALIIANSSLGGAIGGAASEIPGYEYKTVIANLKK